MPKVKIPDDWSDFASQLFHTLVSQVEDDDKILDNIDPHGDGVDITVTIEGKELCFLQFAKTVEESLEGNIKRHAAKLVTAEYLKIRKDLTKHVNAFEAKSRELVLGTDEEE